MSKGEYLIHEEKQPYQYKNEETEIADEDEDDCIFERNRRLYTNSNPNIEQLNELAFTRELPLLRRLLRGFNKGSMRAVVMLWIRMTMGIGIMTTPYFISGFGFTGGIIALTFGALLCYLSFSFIFEASVIAQKKEIADLAIHILPGIFSNMFKFTVFCDYMLVIISYSIVSWNMFEYILSFIGFFKDEWIINKDKMIVDEYNPSVMLIRLIFFGLLFITQIPLFLKEDLSSLRNISIIYLMVMIVFVIYICFEAPFFKSAYSETHQLEVDYGIKPITLNFIPSFFSLLLAFYVQPFCLTLRKELLNPTINRLKKTTALAVGWELGIYAIFGLICYSCFGDKFTPQLMILRISYKDKNQLSEYIFKSGIVVFFFLNIIGLAVFNPSIRNYLLKYSKMQNKDREYKFVSLGPFLVACIIAVLAPNIVTMFWFFGLVFCNYNGFIMPTLMKISVIKQEGQGVTKLILCYCLLGCYVFFGILGVCVKVSHIFSKSG